jgi:DNA-binding response OmpR family regulator
MSSVPMRILIAEDEIFLAMMLQDLLEDAGYQVRKAACVSDALTYIDEDVPDAAILDVNLGGEEVYPVARALRARGVPFIFATGYGQRGLAGEFDGECTLQKPYLPHLVGTHLEQLLRR